MDYLKFYELEREPFQNDADSQFYFESAGHRRARLWLLRGVQQHKSLSVLVGGPGCGKTTLAQHLLENLDDQSYAARLLLISHADCAKGWMLPSVARSFGVKAPAADAPTTLDQIREALVAQLSQRRSPALLVDEAQLLANAAVMEEFRSLLNLTHGGRRLLSILLFGLPELALLLQLDPPLAQRVEVRVDISGLPQTEVVAYVKHRLDRAGAGAELFTLEALDAIASYSGGIPRVINTLADNALFEGFMGQSRPVDASLVVAAAQQLELAGAGTAAREAWVGGIVPEAEIDVSRSIPLDSSQASPSSERALGDDSAPGPGGLVLEPEDDDSDGGGTLGEDSFSDFSMGSLVRGADNEDDEEALLGDSPHPRAEPDRPAEVAGEAASTADAEREPEAEGGVLGDLDLGVPEEPDGSEELEIPLVEPAGESAPAGAETTPDDDGEDSHFDLGQVLGADGEEEAAELSAEPVDADDQGTFDPSTLLAEADDSEAAEAFDPALPERKAASSDAEADEVEDLDDLFESIQVNH